MQARTYSPCQWIEHQAQFQPPFFSPIGHFGVNLVTQFWFDFACFSAKQWQESLCAWIDHVNIVQADHVDNLLLSLKFSLWALHELGDMKCFPIFLASDVEIQ
jgi:hypothetical protein